MKLIFAVALLSLCPLVSFSQFMNAPDSNFRSKIFLAGDKMENYEQHQTASAVTGISGALIIGAAGYTQYKKPSASGIGYYIGGGLIATSLVLNILAHQQIGKAGRYLKMASGLYTIEYRKR